VSATKAERVRRLSLGTTSLLGMLATAVLLSACERVLEHPPLARDPRPVPAASTSGAVGVGGAASPPATGSSAAALPDAPTTSAQPSAPVQPSAPAPSTSAQVDAPSTSAEGASAPTDEALAVPAILGPDGKPLPQTEDRPSVESPAFRRRMQLLWDAIIANDSKIAERAFFPVEAYEQVKDIKNPAADWRSRLLRHFARDVRDYHERLGADPKACRFEGVEIDEGRVQWMKPGREGNRVGYFRITRSRIRYTDPKGRPRTLELTSLISWRGEWFVVHLHGFR
jgi:hypothetical protein